MKKVILKQNSIKPVSSNYLGDYLLTLGVRPQDLDSFIKGPKPTDEDDPFKLLNMDKALEIIHAAAEAGEEFFLQVDSDVDGYTSSTIFYSYMKSRYPLLNITWRLHDGKEHGIILNTIPDNCKIIIIPDAGSMQVEEQKALSEQGKTVVILDHHSIQQIVEFPNVYIVNNQTSPDFENKALSGAGVTYMFIKGYDKKYFTDVMYTQFTDLAALGIIADSMSTKTVGNHYIITKGLSTIRNNMFQALLTKQSYSISDIAHPNKIDIAFYIAPLINGLIRSGEAEEKESFFKAMISNESPDRVETEYRGTARSESIYEYAARVAANAKARQEATKKKAVKFLNEKIESEHLLENTILIVSIPASEGYHVDQNMTGLVAMDLVKTYNRPSLILREKQENGVTLFAGSGRSKEFDGLLSLLPFIRDSGLANFVEGHGNAFGAAFTEENLKQFLTYSNAKLVGVDFNNDVIEVDYWFTAMVNAAMLTVFAGGSHLYGNGIPQPKFAFDMVLENKDIITMGKDNNTLKIVKNGIQFIQFKAADTIAELAKSPRNEVTIIGRSQINSFMGKSNTQVIIDDIAIKAATLETKTQRNVMDLI